MLVPPLHSPTRQMSYPNARRRRKYSGARAFVIVVVAISCLTLWSLIPERSSFFSVATPVRTLRRNTFKNADDARQAQFALRRRDEECRLVLSAADQCAFIRANCPDEEAGLFSYLQLYYCRLPQAKPFAFILLIIWLGLLFSTIGIAASDFFCINLSTIAGILRMSESMAGVTFLAFGNGSPDVFSTFAAMKTHSGSLAVGELIGAAGFITAVVAGSMALVRPFKVARKSFVRDVGFFIVAASFSMVFLADGHLHLWECAVMVAFYIFYVITVVVWHWYLGQRRRRQEQEFVARGHFLVPEADDTEVEPFHDDDEEDPQAGGSRRPSRGVSADDFAALERGNTQLLQPMNEEADEETRGHWMAEISSNMRVSRPARGERRNTANPIRPSLVGALEFRAVLSSLEKSRNIQTIPLNSRRYSDDPTYTTAQQQDQMSSASNPEISYDYVDAHDAALNGSGISSADSDKANAPARVRAVSANDAVGLHLDTDIFQRHGGSRARSMERSTSTRSSEFGYLATSPAPISHMDTRPSPNLLAPPVENSPITSDISNPDTNQDQNGINSWTESPSAKSRPEVPRILLPGSMSGTQRSSPASPFPEYHDDPSFIPRSRPPSILLPPSSIGSESAFLHRITEDEQDRPISWWPYKILPSPQILISTLFPTLYSWRDKNLWEKLLGIIAAPSVLLLSITLPVVEPERDDEMPDIFDPDPGLLSTGNGRSRSQSFAVLPPDSPTLPANGQAHPSAARSDHVLQQGNAGLGPPSIQISDDHSDIVSANRQMESRPPFRRQSSLPLTSLPQADHTKTVSSSPKEWNRWLVAIQIFSAPLFIVLLLWANTDPDINARNLLLPCLYSLIGSLIVLAILVYTTTPSKPPKFRYLFCFVGFIVSIAWISTIANEVVGVLKAFGVILGISDAILGLTIFAVGNSLGDLVADITVAKLGFPVMALSACFGGPMLNILLGIGVSGLYMTIQKGHHKHDKHPNRPIQYQPYQIEVSPTLVISGITLLVTLLGLLVVVPLNKWAMDRKVGWGLVALWTASTVGNVIVEIMGWGWDFA